MAASNSLPQKLNMAQGFVGAATNLTTAWAAIQKYYEIYLKSGLTYESADFNGTSLAYIDPTQMPSLITNLNSFATWMTTNGNGDLCFQVTPAKPATI